MKAIPAEIQKPLAKAIKQVTHDGLSLSLT